MSDPTNPTPGPSEEQARQYAELRSVPAEQILTEVLSSLLNVAQIKLGRRDARLLIDLSGLLIGHARRYLPGELAGQVDQALTQLRLAQVQAENAATGTPGGSPEPNDLPEVPAGPGDPAAAGPTPPTAPAQPAPQPPPASRLWVPGRDF